ncbi:MAG TPA: hypothetical protein VFE33_00490 [Thermoanaerobaculia bacterium]|nr:hypothetical protein [Thermoanaerobaculia bacterium]
MKISIHVNIDCDRYVYATVVREYETDLVPMIGMHFEDTAWKESRTIQGISINPVEGYYDIYVGSDKRKDEDQCEKLKQMYLMHGWREVGARRQ